MLDGPEQHQDDGGAVGVKEAENPLEQIERLLTCAICLDRYKQPKLLPCQHTFCLHCLESYVESGGRPRIRCPECRAEHALPLDGGAQSLQTNLTLLAFLEIHMEASAANAAEMQAYVQRYNLERCRVCEEKATLEMCAHCDRKCCAECRSAHLDMLKRDLSRLLGQVRRLSARVKEASDGLGRGLDQLQANGEQTRQEIRDYFNRYQRELKRREEHFLEQADLFVQNEERLMRTLRDALDVEWNNLQDGCLWVDAALAGEREVRDDELAQFKLEFQQGLDYLRSFQPDSEELFAKKLRFSPGDDAAKLPTAIANFGELNVSLPQFANRYLPLEQQYLPRPFRMSLESDRYMLRQQQQQQQRAVRNERFGLGGGGGAHRGAADADNMLLQTTTSPMLFLTEQQQQQSHEEGAGAQRWRRRRELEEEAWGRLRADAAQSPTHWAGGGVGGGVGGGMSSRNASRPVSPLCIPLDTTMTGGSRFSSPMAPTPSPNAAAAEQKKKKAAMEAEAEERKNVMATKRKQQEKTVEAVAAQQKVEAAKKEEMAQKDEEKEEEQKEENEEKPCPAQPTDVKAKPSEAKKPIGTGGTATTTSSSKICQAVKQTAAPTATAVPRPKPPTAATTAAVTATASKANKQQPTQQQQQSMTTGGGGVETATTTPMAQSPPKNVQAEGSARGRLLMVNGPLRSTAGVVPRRTPPSNVYSHSTNNIHSQQQQQQHPHQQQQHPHQQPLVLIGGTSRLHPKAQKPPLPARRQHSAGDEPTRAGGLPWQKGGGKKQEKDSGEEGNQQRREVPEQQNGEKAEADEEKEEEEEEEEEKDPELPTNNGGGGVDAVAAAAVVEQEKQRGRNAMRIQSQSNQFRIHCRSSSHGRAPPSSISAAAAAAAASNGGRRPSIETGQPIPVAFFPHKTTGEWTDAAFRHQQGGLLLTRSRTNPNLGSAVNLMVSAAKTGNTAALDAAAIVRPAAHSGRNAAATMAERQQQQTAGIANGKAEAGGGEAEDTRPTRKTPSISNGVDNGTRAKKCRAKEDEEEDEDEEDTEDTLEWAKRYEKIRNRPRLVLPAHLNWPRGVCPVVVPFDAQTEEDEAGDLFAVADSSNHRVQLFSAHDGTLRRTFGIFGNGDGQFDGCSSVCVHQSHGELLVADRYNHRVQIFDLNGRFVRKFGCAGTGSGQFQHCWGIAIDEQLGLVYVADKDNHRVQMFDAEGAYLTKFGTMGDGARQFNHPLYLAFHQERRLLYVSDSANNRISVFSADGLPVRQFHGDGPPDSHLKLPRGIAIDQRGFLLVADSGNNQIQVFSPHGQCLRQFGAWGSAPGQFKGVEGICLVGGGSGGGGGDLVIADRENNRLQLFACSG